MITKSEAKYIRISPTKVRPVIKLVKGSNAKEAVEKLEFVKKKAAKYLQKLIKTAIADAKNKGYDQDSLFISRLVANQGPALKRYRAESFGRAAVIRRRMSHLIVELDSNKKIMQEIKKTGNN
ncbi:MAG: 50S ribosomal protein L22 [Candidatus Omnitrophica bacterium]|nr:50S ribosomal protein L22 [Candidatus Omnitrophota bacterium]MCF7893497.1 50S ribosomal protein L22 [Candidatus Omnitrophota bacterium]